MESTLLLLAINTTKLSVDLLKNLMDMLMKYLCLHHVVNLRVFAIDMYDFLYHIYFKAIAL